jgi:hypothetical protein
VVDLKISKSRRTKSFWDIIPQAVFIYAQSIFAFEMFPYKTDPPLCVLVYPHIQKEWGRKLFSSFHSYQHIVLSLSTGLRRCAFVINCGNLLVFE